MLRGFVAGSFACGECFDAGDSGWVWLLGCWGRDGGLVGFGYWSGFGGVGIGLLGLLRSDREFRAATALRARSDRPRVQMAAPAAPAEKLYLAGVNRGLGELAASAARHHRIPAATIRSTTYPTTCMKVFTMNQPVPVAARHAHHSEKPGAVISHAGICERDAGQPAFLP